MSLAYRLSKGAYTVSIKAVVFDIGLTLYRDVGAAKYSREYFSRFLARQGYEYDPLELDKMFHETRRILVERGGDVEYWDLNVITLMLARLGIRNPRLVWEAYKRHVEGVLKGLKLEEGAIDVLEWLRDEKYLLGVLSNMGSHDIVYKLLERDGLLDYFDVVVSSQMLGWKKPDEKVFWYLIRVFGVEPEEIVFIGDDPVADILGAKKAGLIAIHKPRPDTPPSPYADAIINSIGELVRVLELMV